MYPTDRLQSYAVCVRVCVCVAKEAMAAAKCVELLRVSSGLAGSGFEIGEGGMMESARGPWNGL